MAPKSNPPPSHPYAMPMVRSDLVVLCVQQAQLQVLLTLRQEAPHKGRWGLPGGVLRIDLDASLADAAQRVAMERLGRGLDNLAQVVAVGGAKRDPRAPWALTVVYRTLVAPDIAIEPGKRVEALAWRPVADVVAAKDLAFDHAELVALAVESLRQEVRDLRFGRGAAPAEFTHSELQAYCEAILGHPLDKVTFRRRLDAAQLLKPVPGVLRGGAHRPAQVYRLRS